jgi:hypothetical protein
MRRSHTSLSCGAGAPHWRDDKTKSYVLKTIFDYFSARLITRPDKEWLHPLRGAKRWSGDIPGWRQRTCARHEADLYR